MKNITFRYQKPLINVLVLSVMLLGLLGTTQPVSANTIRVNVFNDVFGDGTSTCSLREAIYSANYDIAYDGCGTGAGEDIIVLEPGIYMLSIGVTDYKIDDQDGKLGDLDIKTSMRIVGAGESLTTIRPIDSAQTRIIHINAASTSVTLQGLTLTKGYAYAPVPDPNSPPLQAHGGAIFNQRGRLVIERSTVTGNTASHSGGGIYSNRDSASSLTIIESTVSNNTAELGDGGGIASESLIHVARSLILNNTVQGGNGGGIYNSSSGQLLQVTVAGNKVLSTAAMKGHGSGVYADSSIEVINSTIVRNESALRGRYGIEASAAGVMFNNIIAYNKATEGATSYPANCTFNASVYGAYNYREVDEIGGDGKPICTGNEVSGQVFIVTEPGIGLSETLELNMGRTMNYTLLSTSKVIDKGKPDNLFVHPTTSISYSCNGADQRGAMRPYDGDKNGTRVCDPGAVEYYGSNDPLIRYGQLFLPTVAR